MGRHEVSDGGACNEVTRRVGVSGSCSGVVSGLILVWGARGRVGLNDLYIHASRTWTPERSCP